jgi:hypothetical protein
MTRCGFSITKNKATVSFYPPPNKIMLSESDNIIPIRITLFPFGQHFPIRTMCLRTGRNLPLETRWRSDKSKSSTPSPSSSASGTVCLSRTTVSRIESSSGNVVMAIFVFASARTDGVVVASSRTVTTRTECNPRWC